MLKQLFFIGSVLMMAVVTPAAMADACVYRCGSDEIQFAPGQALQLEVVNHTGGRVSLEQVVGFKPYGMWPDQVITIDAQVGMGGELSVVFWEAAQRPIEVKLHRPDPNLLQIELLPSGGVNDSAVHIVNDGRVMIY